MFYAQTVRMCYLIDGNGPEFMITPNPVLRGISHAMLSSSPPKNFMFFKRLLRLAFCNALFWHHTLPKKTLLTTNAYLSRSVGRSIFRLTSERLLGACVRRALLLSRRQRSPVATAQYQGDEWIAWQMRQLQKYLPDAPS